MIGLNILIVEDEELLLKSMTAFFEKRQFNVFKASSVHAAREIINLQKIHILITEKGMADGKGQEVIKCQRCRNPHSVIVCLTGPMAENEDLVKNWGANFVLQKPFEKKILLDNVLSQLGKDHEGPFIKGSYRF